jgi:hypothetical protein
MFVLKKVVISYRTVMILMSKLLVGFVAYKCQPVRVSMEKKTSRCQKMRCSRKTGKTMASEALTKLHLFCHHWLFAALFVGCSQLTPSIATCTPTYLFVGNLAG